MSSNVTNIQRVHLDFSHIEEMVQEAWHLYQNPYTSFYPVIDTIFEMERIYKEAYMHDHLWVYTDGIHHAYFPFIVDHERQYVQGNGGLAVAQRFRDFAAVVDSDLQKHFKGYNYLVGYPSSHQPAIHHHQNHDSYQLIESLIRSECNLESWDNAATDPNFGILPECLKDVFIEQHSQYHPEDYWDAQSILDHDDRWVVISNTTSPLHSFTGAIMYEKEGDTYAEIYFIDSDDAKEKELLTSLLKELYKRGVINTLCLYDINDKQIEKVLLELGFVIQGDYFCFRRTL